jgi:predicted P-loop ATPase/GTPase
MSDLSGLAANREELFYKLAESIADDGSLVLEGWKDLVLVSHVDDGSAGMNGFCYTNDGRTIPVAPRNFAIFDVIEALREAMAHADGKNPWHAALFRIKRETGEFAAEFEYHHPERWRVTPANVMARALEFAPG